MPSKRIIALLILLIVTATYSITTLYTESPYPTEQGDQVIPSIALRSNNHITYRDSSSLATSTSTDTKMHTASQNSLAHEDIHFLVVGIRLASAQYEALIEHQGVLYKVFIGDRILNNTAEVLQINADHIVYRLGQRILSQYLVGPNLLQSSDAQVDLSMQDYLSMSAQQIGTRPRILSHIVTYTSTPYIADGMLIAPGTNDELFAQIGFMEDDVLKKVNGLSVTVEDQRLQINDLMKRAHTLEFEVMRKGRLITLYLDIPSEALTVTK